jgi:hydrogenase maturation protein HypF
MTGLAEPRRLRLLIRGAVQGVGFRPFVYGLASELELAGWVLNTGQGVEVEVEGPLEQLEAFGRRIEDESPPGASVRSIERGFLNTRGDEQFTIRASECAGTIRTTVLPDIAICADCLRELFDPADRRYLYPFTNCTRCGPRYSVIERLPYDRVNTTMDRFRLCRQCQADYEDPADRRFHAQSECCPGCGPQIELWDERGRRVAARHDALLAAVAAIRGGEIVAVKGLGGFHLMVDAGDDEAVRRLRRRKSREGKPFALMYPSLTRIEAVCEVLDPEASLLKSPQAPIVLLRRCSAATHSGVASAVAPEYPSLGVMLPYTPLHYLLMRELDSPIVATSGNLSDEPICIDEQEALDRLGEIADRFLVHDRPIARAIDDSVVQVVLGEPMVLRRARGYAPLPVPLDNSASSVPSAPVLAVGAHLKNTLALSVGQDVVISQHIGDLETAPALDSFLQSAQGLAGLYDLRPTVIACDAHPDYRSTQWAEAQGKPVVHVQHHYAHALAGMAEHGLEAPVLAVAWDGTGYGGDGTIWGGEFLVITSDGFYRLAHLRPFRLPGGERAVREPRRAALGLLYELRGEALFHDRRDPRLRSGATLDAFADRELRVLHAMLQRGLNAPLTTSAGRLFDAVASLLGICQHAGFEGQPAAALEFAGGEGGDTHECWPFDLLSGADPISADGMTEAPHRPPTPWIVEWKPAVEAILKAVRSDSSCRETAARFHNTLVEMIVAVARRWGGDTVLLTGGCFQNRLLLQRAIRRLKQERFRVHWPQRVPANDGGIALGQIVAAGRALSKEPT